MNQNTTSSPDIVDRPCRGPEDLPAVAALLRTCAAQEDGDATLRALTTGTLADRAAPGLTVAHLWLDPSGTSGDQPAITAVAVLSGALNLRFHIDPASPSPSLEDSIANWVRRQLPGAALNPQARVDVHLHPTLDVYRAALLERHGFTRIESETHRMRRLLEAELPGSSLPPGHRVRPLGGEHELPKFVALFHDAFGAGPTAEGRAARWRQDGHLPELIVEAVDGEFVAFCYCEVGQSSQLPLAPGEGLISQLGTGRAHRRRGFGRAALRAGLQQLRQRGMRAAVMQTGGTNAASLALHAAEGFHLYETVPRLRYSLAATTALPPTSSA